jgi:hypothetical protein
VTQRRALVIGCLVGGWVGLGACNLIGGIEPGEPECRVDGQRNGRETDVDCGGPCNRCEDGRACTTASDCQSATCVEGRCTPTAADCLLDGDVNGEETDVDCGGPCPACEVGADCFEHEDCQSNACFDLVCAEPECGDGRLNGTESDVDCGGHDDRCIRCSGGATCREDIDCASYHLAWGVLGVDPCQDGVCMASCVFYDCIGCDEHCGIQVIDPAAADCCPMDITTPGFRLSDCDVQDPYSCFYPLRCYPTGIMEATCL